MKRDVRAALAALVLGVCLPAAAFAQQKPTVAVMPALYFSADVESADNVTQALAQEFSSHGYRVIPMDRAQATFASIGLDRTRHYGDWAARQLGRRLGADLVVFPQLLAVGIPAAEPIEEKTALVPQAVVLLRVLNAHTGDAIFVRQIGRTVTGERVAGAEFHLPSSEATAVASDATQLYFERVAGSRQEFRRRR